MGLFSNLLGKLSGNAAEAHPWPAEAVVIDVRSPNEYACGHVEGALNLPVDRIVTSIGQHVPDRQQSIVLYCASGMRSGTAKVLLEQQGYSRVINGGSAGNVALRLGRQVRRTA